MRKLFSTLAIVTALVSTAALAQGDVAPKRGAMIVSSDGSRIGRVDSIAVDKAGQPVAASVIYDSRLVHIPLNSLKAGDDGRFVTSLTRKEVSARN